MKRFYKLVSVHEEPRGWAVQLDGKPVKTPMRETLRAPNKNIANVVQQEWSAQEEEINPETMPLTQILSTHIDRVSAQRNEMSAAILKYLDTDLLCYRAPSDPPGPAEKQEEIWQPYLDWFGKRFGVKLETTSGLAALTQPEEAHKAVKDAVESMDDLHFTLLQLVVSGSGSLILGLAFMEKAITPEEIMAAARVEENLKDEMYNAEFYGRDPLFEKKDAALLQDLKAAAEILKWL